MLKEVLQQMGSNTDGKLSLHKGFHGAEDGNCTEILKKGFSYYLSIFKKSLLLEAKIVPR